MEEERLLLKRHIRGFVARYFLEENLHVTDEFITATSEAILSQCTLVAHDVMRLTCQQLHQARKRPCRFGGRGERSV
ncbi:hypothetical protein SY88_13555 [Clostridiales bacterium PH28_bin88]|nr:hypothetical protein SY88_13555 [Clostridiales bacterium PH28_bin88]